MTMLEKAALAIAAKMQDAPVDMATFSWDDVNGWTKEMAFDCARAALMAIREVDQETYNAGWDAMSGEPDAGPGEPWLAMIDAILEGKA
jgi:hypothetical protein